MLGAERIAQGKQALHNAFMPDCPYCCPLEHKDAIVIINFLE